MDLIDNMVHMRISGIEPSSVILIAKQSSLQSWKSDAEKVPKRANGKQDGAIRKPTKTQFQSTFITQKILMFSKRYESIEVDCRT